MCIVFHIKAQFIHICSLYTRTTDGNKPEVFEWYQRYDGIKDLLTPKYLAPPIAYPTNCEEPPLDREKIHLSKHRDGQEITNNPRIFPAKSRCRVLIIGCGNSHLGEEMMLDGWLGGISNVDYSNVVISQMKQHYDEDFYRKLRNRFNRERKSRKYSEKEENRLPKFDENKINHCNAGSDSTLKGDTLVKMV